MVIRRGDIWWAALPAPTGSEPGYDRPVIILQSDDFNASRIRTVVAVVITSNVNLATAPGNVLLPRKSSGLPKTSVANVSQIVTLDKDFLKNKVRRLSPQEFAKVEAGVRLVLKL